VVRREKKGAKRGVRGTGKWGKLVGRGLAVSRAILRRKERREKGRMRKETCIKRFLDFNLLLRKKEGQTSGRRREQSESNREKITKKEKENTESHKE